MRPTLRVINRYRKAWGLRRYGWMDDSYSSLAQITQLFREFDFPRSAMPACFHYVGSLTADRNYTTEGFPWDRLDGRPVIYASLGTVADPMNRPAYPKIAAACQGLPAQLVLARGKWDAEDAGQEATHDLPGNPLVVNFAPQLALLDRCAVLITHAGLNTTLEAISRGVPMVAMPRTPTSRAMLRGSRTRGPGLCAVPSRHAAGVARRRPARLERREVPPAGARAPTGDARRGGPRRAAEIVEEALLTRRPVPHRENDVPAGRATPLS